MDTNNEDRNVLENSAYDPFPEPRTIPAGWDLSGLATPKGDSLMDENEEVES